MADPSKMNNLLKWSIAHSSDNINANAPSAPDSQPSRDPSRGLDAEALAELMGGPSDADRMREAMTAITSPQLDIANKLIAFDNFELLIENLDNANNMENLGLWMPLVQQLNDPEPQLRKMAAWCCATAVQNNVKAQERLLVVGGVERIARMAWEEADRETRKKAILALSSTVRNYQPGLDLALKELEVEIGVEGKVDANDMDAVDGVVGKLRERLAGMP